MFSQDLQSSPVLHASAGWRVSAKIQDVCRVHEQRVAVTNPDGSTVTYGEQACIAIAAQECDFALAGGAVIRLPQSTAFRKQNGGVLSPTGRMRPFDADSDGIVPGYGAAVVLLTTGDRAEQLGLPIRARILGGAMNNDGRAKAGFTAPSIQGQASVLSRALARSRIGLKEIRYVEAHGTGTQLGDPMEIESLRRVYGGKQEKGAEKQTGGVQAPIEIGSIKANFGHLDAAAGALGFIKAALVAERRIAPPQASFQTANPLLSLGASPFRISKEANELSPPDEPIAVGVSAFGLGGTNVHLILGSGTRVAPASELHPGGSLLRLSAKDEEGLRRLAGALADFIERTDVAGDGEFAALARTLERGREEHEFRATLVVGPSVSPQKTGARLRQLQPRQAAPGFRTVFVFPGQASGMPFWARELALAFPAFSERVEARLHAIPEAAAEISAFLAGEPDAFSCAAMLQPALVLFQIAAAETLTTLTVSPVASLGHSLGELAAAAVTGGLPVETALRMALFRGTLTDALPPGRMAAVLAPEVRVRAAVDSASGVEISAVNSSRCTVISGPPGGVAEVAGRCGADGMDVRFLDTDRGFHSPLLDPVLSDWELGLTKLFAGVQPAGGEADFYSMATAGVLAPEQLLQPQHWVSQFRRPVCFADTLRRLLREVPQNAVVEIGDPVLHMHILDAIRCEGMAGTMTVCFPGDRISGGAGLPALGTLWSAGSPLIPLSPANSNLPDVPGHPLQRHFHHYANARADGEAPEIGKPARGDAGSVKVDVRTLVEQVWRDALRVTSIGADDDFFDLGGDSLLAVSVCGKLEQELGRSVPLERLMREHRLGAFAASLEHQDFRNGASILFPSSDTIMVPLRRAKNAAAPPIFALHPAGGTVFPFFPSVSRLRIPNPVIGIQFPHWQQSIWEDFSIERLGHLYAGEILRKLAETGARAAGLMGYSFGGNVAHVVACELQAHGIRTDPIVFLDSHPPEAYPDTGDDSVDYEAVIELIFAALQLPLPLMARMTAVMRSEPDEQDVFSLAEHGFTVKDVHLFYRIWQTNHIALKRHRPASKLDANLVYLSAKQPQDWRIVERLGLDRSALENPELWSGHITGTLRIIEVEGSHYSMMSPKQSPGLAEVLQMVFNP